jgi:hypothetical protein
LFDRSVNTIHNWRRSGVLKIYKLAVNFSLRKTIV